MAVPNKFLFFCYPTCWYLPPCGRSYLLFLQHGLNSLCRVSRSSDSCTHMGAEFFPNRLRPLWSFYRPASIVILSDLKNDNPHPPFPFDNDILSSFCPNLKKWIDAALVTHGVWVSLNSKSSYREGTLPRLREGNWPPPKLINLIPEPFRNRTQPSNLKIRFLSLPIFSPT